MHPFLKFLVVVTIIVIIAGLIFKISRAHADNNTDPVRIPTHAEVVGPGFSALGTTRVLDPRDAGPLLQPGAELQRVTDDIISIACPKRHYECITKALHAWVRQNIEYIQVLPTRDHVISPEETILYRQGDDLTLSVLFASMLRSQGITAKVGHTAYSTFVELNSQTNPIRIDPGCTNCGLKTIRYSGDEDSIIWIE